MRVRIKDEVKEIRAVEFEEGKVKCIDQRSLPQKLEFFTISNYKDGCFAIREMVVRGAPAIGVTAAYALALAYLERENLKKAAAELRATRPTAHDLFYAVDYMLREISCGKDPVKVAESYADDIVNKCKRIGEVGERAIKKGDKILTHCNAGALATVDWGTALAPIRLAHRKGKFVLVWVDETRPRLQGALTSWELVQEGIEHYVIVDNAAGYFMREGEVDMVIVGADRIARNGDFANKIGTYACAMLAKENKIPFYVAAPISTFDFEMKKGDEIEIEERTEEEVLYAGGEKIMPQATKARNPAFDLTPAKYVTGVITEKGLIKPNKLVSLFRELENIHSI